ncbi:hypothetical protein T459_01419 [Capsicum annuum]|uniref:Exostosin GT47 domain-containing protein n=1 Tax=Capsicum annuum TaxID=4072 RepID=A0A2G3AH33_CAPAN|nr:hypothetical protein T459_01419 [Capsicum annuum]
MVVDFLKQTEAWKRSGGRDHVFVITDPVAMWHVKAEVAPAILLVVDFGGWYKLDSNESSSDLKFHCSRTSLCLIPIYFLLVMPCMSSWLVNHLRSYSNEQKDRFRRNMALVQPIFEYENGQPGGIGPISPNGAINYIWRKVHQKLPMIKETIIREKRKPPGVTVSLRCHCT